MATTIGISAADRASVGFVEEDRVVASVVQGIPLFELPVEEVVQTLAGMVQSLCVEHHARPAALGVGFPGIIRDGVVEESPNLKQAKGANLRRMLFQALESRGMSIPVSICNDADATATGIAARFGHLEKFIRVWNLGQGVGFGRYPHSPGPCEGGHTVVSIDPKETYCGCGGRGHLEGIVGHRAMRLRFLDREPEEIFASARQGDPRCAEFELLWHRALAAASATSVHLDGPGKFFLTGPNARFANIGTLSRYLQEMVTMSPLQGSVFEIVPGDEDFAVLGAAVNARTRENLS